MNSRYIGILLAAICLVGCKTADETPETHLAIVQTGNGGPEVLALESVSTLVPGPDQVLIRVYAAAVNPVDWKMREGYSGRGRPVGTPPPDEPPKRIPGFDVSGVIAATGSDVTNHEIGDAVFSMIGRMDVAGLNGAYAEYVLAPADRVLPKPENVSHEEAAGMATVGLTAMRVLHPLDIQPGQRVFINGIAGGVGSSAAQIAKARGAVVIGTASARHHDYLESIGVDQVVDYTEVDFVEVVDSVDVYVETVNAEIAARGLVIIRPGGNIASVVGLPPAAACAAAGIECPAMGPPGGPPQPGALSEAELLWRVQELASDGAYRVNIDKTFPLAEAAAAQEYNREGHTTGKVILTIDHKAR